jgi:AcrR family transcriptional regulator
MTVSESAQSKPDGRRARSERTRAAIIDSMMELIEAGNLAPTSEEIANHAGVGHRTVFRHFEDMDSLYREISQRVESRILDAVKLKEPEGTLVDRIESLVTWRAGAYEKMKNFRRSSAVKMNTSKFIRTNRLGWAEILRERMFKYLPEMEKCSEAVQSGVEVLLSFDGWEQLRVEQRLSQKAARQVQAKAVLELLVR